MLPFSNGGHSGTGSNKNRNEIIQETYSNGVHEVRGIDVPCDPQGLDAFAIQTHQTRRQEATPLH